MRFHGQRYVCTDPYQERALIVHPVTPQQVDGRKLMPDDETAKDQAEEAIGLALAINLEIEDCFICKVQRPTPGHFLGKGNREEIALLAEELEPDIIIVNHTLSPVQQRNLERQWKAKVIDRTGLILEIFGARAQTSEGKIQVELAALEYQRSRLVRSWTHLERQRGGAGFMGGPGETQIELDRRMITDRIAKLKKDLEGVRKNRELQRRSREQVPYPVVAMVGYTNAGKSTLFNKITGANVFAEDLLFATLDPTMRKVELPNGQDVIFSDTVGFISDLPTHLVAAFRATLEQVQYAEVILHVRDIAKADSEAQRTEVISILADLGIEYENNPRIIEVWNKLDLVAAEDRADITRKGRFQDNCVVTSALTGEGTDALLENIEDILTAGRREISLSIPNTDGKALAWLYDKAEILSRQDDEEHVHLEVEIEPADLGRFCEKFKYQPVNKDDDDKTQVYGTAN